MKKDPRYEINWPSNHIIHLPGFLILLPPLSARVEKSVIWNLLEPSPAEINIQSVKINTTQFFRAAAFDIVLSLPPAAHDGFATNLLICLINIAAAMPEWRYKKLRIGGAWFSSPCADFVCS